MLNRRPQNSLEKYIYYDEVYGILLRRFILIFWYNSYPSRQKKKTALIINQTIRFESNNLDQAYQECGKNKIDENPKIFCKECFRSFHGIRNYVLNQEVLWQDRSQNFKTTTSREYNFWLVRYHLSPYLFMAINILYIVIIQS